MFRDHSLVPAEAIRLAALGLLAERERAYGELAAEVRHFVSRILGPSLDALGPSLELLRYEGLVEPLGAALSDGQPVAPDGQLRLTESGRAMLATLLAAHVRTPINDVGKLVIALKLRFMHLIDRSGRNAELDRLSDSIAAERARLADLRQSQAKSEGYLVAWLDREIAEADQRVAWLGSLRERA